MKSRPLTTALAIFLTVVLIAPSAFLVAPPKAHAALTSVIEVGLNLFENTIGAIEETLNVISTYTNTAANVAEQINTYVLQPLAFVLSGNLMKMLTSGVIAFVIGKANGTGVPQFVVDVNQSLQTVGDSAALAYLRQFGTNSNSPFSASIASALKNNYLQKTSLAGFWAANMNTLARTSPNVPAYLSGRWSQGGIAAWFALTTQTQNNPYTFYQVSQAQMAGLVGSGAGGATGVRLSQLSWGQGFMSWCGAREGTTEDNDGTAMEETTTEDNDGTAMESGGVNPGDPCTDEDGNPGTIKTPGSLIKSTLDKVLGGQQDQIVRMGNVGGQITGILSNIATVMQTAQFASQILGGSDSGGLFGVDSPTAGNSRSALYNFTPTQNAGGFTSDYLGVSNSSIYQSAATIGASGSDKAKLIEMYQSGWDAIGASANAASINLTDLANFCTTAANTESASESPNTAFINAARGQATDAQTALATEVAPVLNRVAAVGPITAVALAMVEKIQCELNAPANTVVYCDLKSPTVPTNVTTEYPADMQTLQTMPPTAEDVAALQQESQDFGGIGAQENPAGSLTVSANPSVVDQMNLISANAQALKTSVCTQGGLGIDYGGG